MDVATPAPVQPVAVAHACRTCEPASKNARSTSSGNSPLTYLSKALTKHQRARARSNEADHPEAPGGRPRGSIGKAQIVATEAVRIARDVDDR